MTKLLARIGDWLAAFEAEHLCRVLALETENAILTVKTRKLKRHLRTLNLMTYKHLDS